MLLRRLLWVVCLASGCGKSPAVDLQIRVLGNAQKSALQPVDQLVLEAFNPTTGVSKTEPLPNGFAGANAFAGGALPILAGGDWHVLLTGVDRNHALYALGRTTAFTVPTSGSVNVPLVLGIADDFAASASGDAGAVGPFSTATSLGDGSVLLVGPGGVSLHTPATGQTCTTCLGGTLPPARTLHTATMLANGNVLIVGGQGAQGQLLGDAYLLDTTRTFTSLPLARLPARAGSAAALLSNGRVLLAGGRAGAAVDGARVVLVDADAQTVVDTAPLPAAVVLPTATRLANGSVLVAGGLAASGAVTTATLYSSDGTTAQAAPPMVNARAAHSATLLGDGSVLVFGGFAVEAGPNGPVTRNLAAPEAFVATAPVGSFLSVLDFGTLGTLTGRSGHAAIALDNGDVLFAGGDIDPVSPPDPNRQAPALRFSPGGAQAGVYAGTFSAAGTVAARLGVAAAVLPDMSVLVVGGARTALGVDPTVTAAAADWTSSLDLFVPCGVKNSACPR